MRIISRQIVILIFSALVLVSCSQDSLTDKEYLEKATRYYETREVYASIIELKNALKVNARNSDARLLLGRVYLQLADGVSAEKELLRAREYGNQSNDITLLLTKALLLQAKPDLALKELSTLATDLQSKSEALALKTEIYLSKGELGKAQEFADKLETSTPVSVDTYLAIAKLRGANKQFNEADLTIDKALSIDGKSSEAWLLKGAIADLQGDIKKAQDAYKQVIANEPKRYLTPRVSQARTALAFIYLRENDINSVKEHVDILYKANATHFIPNYINAVIAYRDKNYQQALEYLRVANANNEQHPPTRLLLGSVNFALGYYNQAASYLARYNREFPQNVAATRLLGATYIKLGETSKAMNVLKSSLEDNPNDSQLLALVGEVAARQGDLKAAESYIRKSMKAGGDSSKAHIQLATAYMASGEFDAAIEELKNLEKSSGVDEFARIRALILAYLKKNQTKEALKEAKEYANRFSGEARAFNMLGAVYLSIRDVESAKLHFNNALKIDSKNITALLNLARISVATNDYSDGRVWLEKTLDVDKNNVLAMLLLARVEEKNGKMDEAINWLEKARSTDPKLIPPRLLLANYYFKLKEYSKVHLYINEVLETQSGNRLALGLMVDTYWQQGEKDKALSSALLMVERAPKQAEAHTKLGQVYAGQSKFSKARSSFKQALVVQPGFNPAVIALVKLELREGKPDQAIAIVKKLQQQQPNSPVGFALEGDIHMSQKDFQGASKMYEKALGLGQSSVLVGKLANALYRAGKPWSAIQTPLMDWLKNYPDDDALRLRLGMLARAKGEIKTSIAAYQQILEHQPANIAILNDYAWMLYEHTTSHQEAVTLAKKAYELKPDLPAVQDTYGWILINEGKVTEGLQLVKKAHDAMPEHPDIRYHLAYGLYKDKKPDESRKVVNKLLKDKKEFDTRGLAEKLSGQLNIENAH